MILPLPRSTLFPYTTLFRSKSRDGVVLDRYYTENRSYIPYEEISPHVINALVATEDHRFYDHWGIEDRKSTRLNSSHVAISYAVFCLKKKKQQKQYIHKNYH